MFILVSGSYVYQQSGNYVVSQTIVYTDEFGNEYECQKQVGLKAKEYCCVNFAPEESQRYWISGWVKEEHLNQVRKYNRTYIEFEFNNSGSTTFQFSASGDIIDGWQRIIGDFIVPYGATEMNIHLVNTHPSVAAFFDDIRVHPFNASMKSYVYDPETLWLTAELDDNNYATFYEYDNEGQLIRIKKETARGIMTIQESRSSNPKKN